MMSLMHAAVRSRAWTTRTRLLIEKAAYVAAVDGVLTLTQANEYKTQI